MDPAITFDVVRRFIGSVEGLIMLTKGKKPDPFFHTHMVWEQKRGKLVSLMVAGIKQGNWPGLNEPVPEPAQAYYLKLKGEFERFQEEIVPEPKEAAA